MTALPLDAQVTLLNRQETLMLKYAAPAIPLVAIAAVLLAQTPPITGDRGTPLRALGGEGNSHISNAVLREQSDVRVLRVVLEPGGTRAMHAHDGVKFHLFIPISGAMTLLVDGAQAQVQPWHPYYMAGGTRHGFRNTGPDTVEIMEVFVH